MSGSGLPPRAANARGTLDVCLAYMPYAPLGWPPLGISSIAAALKAAGLSVKVMYPSFWLAKTIGVPLYETFCREQRIENLLGEWIFSQVCFGTTTVDDGEYLDQVLANGSRLLYATTRLDNAHDPRELLLQMRDQADGFIEDVVNRILSRNPRIVACGSSFQQNLASLALLRRIKERAPEVKTAMGGVNCEREMGLAIKRGFPWVDYVVSGEGDQVFPELCRKLLASPADLEDNLTEAPPGIFSAANTEELFRCRRQIGPQTVPSTIVDDITDLPPPDFDDYFEAVAQMPGGKGAVKPVLVFEASRGCWKGCRKHCAFCGLNGDRMIYRSKYPKHVIDELEFLGQRYAIDAMMAADTILDMKYMKTLFPQLAKTEAPYRLFFETSANLDEEHVGTLAKGCNPSPAPLMKGLSVAADRNGLR